MFLKVFRFLDFSATKTICHCCLIDFEAPNGPKTITIWFQDRYEIEVGIIDPKLVSETKMGPQGDQTAPNFMPNDAQRLPQPAQNHPKAPQIARSYANIGRKVRQIVKMQVKNATGM